MRPGLTSTLLSVIILLLAAFLAWPGAGDTGQDLGEMGAHGDRYAADAADVPSPSASGAGRLIVDLVDGSGEAQLQVVEQAIGADLAWIDPRAEDEALAFGDVADLAAAIAVAEGLAEVEVAEPQLAITMASVVNWVPGLSAPNDPLYSRQWNLGVIGVESGWTGTVAGAGVTVAVVDTGVRQVEDLGGTALLEGASFVVGVGSSEDDNGHGTHVAGTIAQTTNNGLGVAGIAPGVSILPVKVLSGFGAGTSDGVAAGIDWAADAGADIINLSLGGPVYSEVIHNAIRKARAAGVLVVAAAGNDGRMGVSWPGALRECIGVSAFGPSGDLAPYSNWGLGVDIAAPGGDKTQEGGGILQDTIEGGGHAYKEFQGTSMAAPHVSGALAVLLSTGLVDADGAEVALLASADGLIWEPRFGHGRMSIAAALDAIGAGTDRSWRFVLGGLLGWVLGAAASQAAGFRLMSALLAALCAGGAFFVGSTGWAPAWSTVGTLHWPVLLLGPRWGLSLVWVAAVVPVGLAFLVGPFRALRPLAIGVAGGFAVQLIWGMARGAFVPWWLSGPWAGWWFGGQAVLSVLAALAVAGVHRMEARRR